MKTRKKLLIALLSATCAASCALGLAACGKNNQTDNRNPDIYAVYQSYVAYAQDNSAEVMTYEQWLETIKGAQGVKGDKGDKGDNGKSAYELYQDAVYKEDPNATPMTQAQWLASLKGDKGDPGEPGETPTVHEHTYDDKVSTIFDATSEYVGLGYKTCTATDCDHIELVVIPSYSYVVYVTDADNKPVSGATVTINGVSITTDEKGVAAFKDIESGEYDVVVEKEGFGVLKTPNTAEDTEFSVALYPTPEIKTEGSGWEAYSYFEPVIGDKVGDSASYLISLDYDFDWFMWNQLYALLKPDESGYATYTMSVEGEYYSAANAETYEGYFLEGNSDTVTVTGDTLITFDVYGVGGSYDAPDLTTVSYVVTFTRVETQIPQLGTEDEPQPFEVGEAVSVEAYEYYFEFTAEYGVNYTFEANDTTLSRRAYDLATGNVYYEVMASDEVLEGWGNKYIIKAQSTSGNISFKVTVAEGDDNPGDDDTDLTALNLGENEVGYAIYKLEITEAGSYTFSGIGYNDCMVGTELKSNSYGMYVDPSTSVGADSKDYENKVFTYTLGAGTYYVATYEDNMTTLTIAKVAE